VKTSRTAVEDDEEDEEDAEAGAPAEEAAAE